jgi:hypothetical protein
MSLNSIIATLQKVDDVTNRDEVATPLFTAQQDLNVVSTCLDTLLYAYYQILNLFLKLKLCVLNAITPITHRLRRKDHPVYYDLLQKLEDYITRAINTYSDANSLQNDIRLQITLEIAYHVNNHATPVRAPLSPPPNSSIKTELQEYATLVRSLHHLILASIHLANGELPHLPLGLARGAIETYLELSYDLLQTLNWTTINKLAGIPAHPDPYFA